MTLNIQIRKNEHGNLAAIFENEDGRAYGYNSLFQFAHRNGAMWLFWLRRGYRASDLFEGKRKDFPLAFFIDACRATYFLHPRGGELPDEVRITYGGGHIGMRKTK